MRHLFGTILLILSCLFNVAAVNDLKFYKITTYEGLSHNTVYSIIQDHKRFMWFGSREGLNKFDSNEIITYYTNPADSSSLTSNHIAALGVRFLHRKWRR